MTNNFLLLNSDKTEIFLWLDQKKKKKKKKKKYTESLGLEFATRWMYCYFLYSQKIWVLY